MRRVPRRVLPDGVAAVDDAGHELERLVVVTHGFGVRAPQEFEVAREVVRARAQFDRDIAFVRDGEPGAERALDLRVAKLGELLLRRRRPRVASPFLVPESPAESLAQMK